MAYSISGLLSSMLAFLYWHACPEPAEGFVPSSLVLSIYMWVEDAFWYCVVVAVGEDVSRGPDGEGVPIS